MRRIKRKDLEKGLSDIILSAAEMLEDLHIAHCKDDVSTLLALKVGNTTIAKIINNLYKVIEPMIELARKKFKRFFEVFDWAALVVKTLLA